MPLESNPNIPTVIPAATDDAAVTVTPVAPPVEAPPAPSGVDDDAPPTVDDGANGPEITADDFNQFVRDPFTQEVSVEELKPVEEDPASEITPPAVVKPDANQPIPSGTDSRDYSDLPPEVIPHFKKMGGKAFDFLKPVYKEHQELKRVVAEKEAEIATLKEGRIPDSYYEHPNAYVLTPEFERTAANSQKAAAVLQHWQKQAKRIAEGEDTYTELVEDQDSGGLRESAPLKVTPDAEGQVQKYVTGSQHQLMRIQMALETVGKSHQQTAQKAMQELSEFEDNAFRQFAGEPGKKLAPLVKDTLTKILPSAFRNSPLAAGYAKALITIRVLGMELEKAKKGSGNAVAPVPAPRPDGNGGRVAASDIAKAGPTVGDLAGATKGGANGEDTVDYSEFKQFARR
jgi:hypothetical protein